MGTAVGDALGLPVEGLSQKRQQRLLGKIEGHRLFFGRGLISDDTEHTIFTAQALFACEDSPERFADLLASRLRRWVLLVPAGVGFATLRACLKLLVGVPPTRSGVFSAGNGPAMRAALLGVCCGNQPEMMRALVRASTRLTHTDPKAEYGAFAVALVAHYSAGSNENFNAFLTEFQTTLPDDKEARELLRLLSCAGTSVECGESTEVYVANNFARSDRVSGYVYQTVPAALHAWIRHPTEYRAAILEVIACGGDTDTVAAITGAIIGARVGENGIPSEWISGVADWPYSVAWMRRLASALAEHTEDSSAKTVPDASVPALMLRNTAFLLVVLFTLLRWYTLDVFCFVRSLLNGTIRENYLK